MKKNKILVLICTCLLLGGCTKYLTGEDSKRVINEETGQTLPSNILCKPTEENLTSIYEQYEDKLPVKLEDLPECKELKIYNSKTYSGLWAQLVVMPLAYLIIKLGNFIGNYGLSVMLVGVLIRLILLPFSAKTMKQSENMKKAGPALARLEKKYENKTDQESMMAKSTEMLQIYKKYNINPMGSCLVSLIQFPLFFGFLEAINRIPAIFEGTLGAYHLGITPLIGLKSGNYYYIILLLLIMLTTYLSFKNSMNQTTGNPEQDKQMKSMTYIMLIFITIASFSLPTAIALYWVVTNGVTVIQNIILTKGKK